MKMLCRTLMLMGLVAFVTGAVSVEYKGDHYDGSTTGSTSSYSASVWDYDYTHTVTSGSCKDSSGSTVTCSTTTKCGPACWGVAGGSANKCAGTNQTPINLVPAEVDPSLEPPEFIVKNGGCDTWVQFGDDHAFEVSFSDAGKECTNLQLKFKGTQYTLQQFHFHAPSEHGIASGLGAAELHMVHKAGDGSLLVLGVLMQVNGIPYGGGNQFLKKFWKVANAGYTAALTKASCTTLTTACAGTTTSGSKDIACGAAPAGVIGDFLYDPTSTCIANGATIAGISGNILTMSIKAPATCSSSVTRQFYTKANALATLVKSSCNPSNYVNAKEAAFYDATGANAISGLCKYALEYEVSGVDVINPYVEFLPADKSFYTYSGSLTTYPCTEGVTWLVFEQPMMVSTDDVKKIMASAVCEPHTITKLQTIDGDISANANNRPLQPLGTRKLYKYDHAAKPDAVKETAVAIAAIVLGSVGLVLAGGAIGIKLAGPKGLDFSKTAPSPVEESMPAPHAIVATA